MKANPAAIRIVDGVGEQMVNINNHRADHDQEGLTPALQIPYPGDKRRNNEMES